MKMRFDVRAGLLACFLANAIIWGLVSADDTQTVNLESSVKVWNAEDLKMCWGAWTNFEAVDPLFRGDKQKYYTLKVGIAAKDGEIVLAGKPLRVARGGVVYLVTEHDPPVQCICVSTVAVGRVVVNLVDSNGMPVPKTAKGKVLERPYDVPSKENWRKWFRAHCPAGLLRISPESEGGSRVVEITSPGARSPNHIFDPTEYFRFDRPGEYKLSLGLRIVVLDTNMNPCIVTVPPATVTVRVEPETVSSWGGPSSKSGPLKTNTAGPTKP